MIKTNIKMNKGQFDDDDDEDIDIFMIRMVLR